MSYRRALVAALMCSGLLAQSSPASAAWTRVSSPHFVFVGNASERTIRSIGQRLEQFRDVAGRVLSAGAVASAVPAVVVVFEDDRSFVPFTPVYNRRPVAVSGYFVGMEDVNYIAVNAEHDTEAYGVIFHEYAHFLTANAYGSTPTWVNEGLAEFYQTFEVSGDRAALIGRASEQNLDVLRRGPLMRVADLIAVGHDSPLYNESDRRGLFYAQSWALVHYLTFGSPARQGQLLTYLSAIREGTPAREAFSAAFGADTTALDRELQQYVRAFAFGALRVEFSEKLVAASLASGQTLSDVEASGYLGDLLARLNRADDARAYLTKVIDGSAESARAMTSLGLLELRAANEAAALPLLEKAVALSPNDPQLLSAYGRVLTRIADRGMDGQDAQYQRARSVLNAALALEPDNAPVLVSLAEVEMGLGVDTERAVTLMRSAVAAAPGREEYRLMLAQALAVNRDYQGASAMLGVLMARGSRPEVRDAARQTLTRVAQARVAAERLNATLAASAAIDADAPATVDASSGGGTAPAGFASAPGDADRARRPTMPQGVYQAQLRPLGAGETRVQGTFAAIDCRPGGSIVLRIDTPDGPVQMLAAGFKAVEFITYRESAPTGVTCGTQRPAMPVLATFRSEPSADDSTSAPKRAVAIEVVPDGFTPR